ncbi:heme peroxidase [Thelonectria olida]|uniref:Peroxidase n=1 Tax=Thelonectria olida TaxID=1576542 RepID=A0A9P8WEP9_9HYPO|nr:heme peroxidase [Thelonectria olida]
MKNAILIALAVIPFVSADLVWPSKWDELEDFYSMLSGYNRRGFADAVNPCDFGSNVPGRHNAAQWIRTAFHDMATHDAKAGTGGIDASIFWELNRPENPGDAFENTFGFFSGFHSIRASASDLIALGVVTANGVCNGPKMAMRAGRIDANKAGPTGVPEPSTDLKTTLGTFQKAGFTKQDMIAMVACGHSLGGVHSVDFPDVTSIKKDPNNDTLVPFQKNIGSINNGVVTEFLDGTTKNPLVVARNKTLNSDKRIFSSDQKYMSTLKDPKTFQSVCGDIFTRMIETVPKNVKLTDAITPYDVKPYIDHLSLNAKGDLSFQGTVRLRITKGSGRDVDNLAVKLIYADRDGKGKTAITATRANFQNGLTSGLYGEVFVSFEFDATIKSKTGISKFWIEETNPKTKKTKTHDNQRTGGYPINDNVLYQMSQSCLDTDKFANGKFPITVTAMVREQSASSPLSLRVIQKVPRKGISVPRLQSEVTNFTATGKKQSGYVAYRASTRTTDSTTFDILLGSKVVVDFQRMGAMPSTCPK